MAIRSNVVALLSSLVLFACGASSQEAKGPESNPWADYKGTYATTAGSSAKVAKAEVAKGEAKAAHEAAPEQAAIEEAPVSTGAPAKKAKGPAKAAKAPAKTGAPAKKK